MFIDEDEDTIVIELYAQQFNWTARVQEKTMYWENEGVNILGVDLILMHRMI
jgi:cytochrome c oxidase subunit 2